MSILTVLSKQRVTSGTVVFGGPGTGFRAVYVESNELPADEDTEMAMVEFTPLGPEETSFVAFLDSHVEEHEDGKITIGDFWDAWAVRYGADASKKLIGGITRLQAARLFRARFRVSEQTRAHIRGPVQRCWNGLRMIPADA